MLKTNLTELRKQIDFTDHQLIGVLKKRASLVELVGKLKKLSSIPPMDPSRWQEVLKSRREWGSELGLDPHFVQDVFNRIHEYSLQIEGGICQK